jgi:hypothetical protein
MTSENMWRGVREGHPTRDPGLRAADEDREAVAAVLREQHAAGRLDTDELQERMDRCYAARTLGELDGLLGDLPRPAAPGATWRPRRRVRLVPLVALLAALAAVCAVTGAHAIWLVVPVLFVSARLLRGRRGFGWTGRGCGPA